MSNKLICLEGIDATGKSTQFELLKEKFSDIHTVEFPRYHSAASYSLKQYLNGAYGDADSVNHFAASALFAADRLDWHMSQQTHDNTLCYRYTTSNAVHQAAKLPIEDIIPFCDWLFDWEYNKLGLPRPDEVIYLYMDMETSSKLLKERGDGDIHENDDNYRKRAHDAGLLVSQHYNWRIIDCAPNRTLRTINDIHKEIYEAVRTCLYGCNEAN